MATSLDMAKAFRLGEMGQCMMVGGRMAKWKELEPFRMPTEQFIRVSLREIKQMDMEYLKAL